MTTQEKDVVPAPTLKGSESGSKDQKVKRPWGPMEVCLGPVAGMVQGMKQSRGDLWTVFPKKIYPSLNPPGPDLRHHLETGSL